MADITLLSRLLNGVQRNVDLSQNSLVVGSLKVGSVTPSELTQAILDNLINLQNGSDFANGTNSHTHDGRYYTEAELTSRLTASGATLVGVERKVYSNITGYTSLLADTLGNYNIQALLDAINTTFSTASAVEFLDNTFRIDDNGDPTKKIAFEASGISTATTRTITMPDADVNLADANNAILKNGSRAFTANQPMGGFKLTGLAAGSVAGDSVRYEQAILVNGANAFTANQSMGSNKITSLAAGSVASDAVNYGQVILKDGSNPFTADQSHGGFKITNLGAPVSGTDAANKSYVDSAVTGLDWKQSVQLATTANITLSGEQTIDGVLTSASRVLVKNQSTASQNGLYLSAAGAWSRTTDADQDVEVTAGLAVFIEQGTINSDSGWVLVTDNPIVVGTTALTFTQFTGLGQIIAGSGLTKTGNQLDVGANADSSITVNADDIQVHRDVAGAIGVTAAGIKANVDGTSIEISSNALRIAAGAAGDGLGYSAGVLNVNVDGSTLETNSDALRVKDAGITLAKLASNSVDENKIVSTSFNAAGAVTGGSGSKIAVQVDGSTIEIAANALRVKDAGITAAKLNTNVADQDTITGGAGAALAVQSSPQSRKIMIAGESFAANTSFLVRWAVSGETAGRVYKADKDASVSDKFWCVGIAFSTSAQVAGGNLTVVVLGSHTLQSSDSAFAAGDIGKPVWLQSSGAFSTTPPSSSNQANFKIGMVESTTKVWVDKQMMGVF